MKTNHLDRLYKNGNINWNVLMSVGGTKKKIVT